jgi:MFS family permease
MRQALAPVKLPGFAHLAFAYTVNELGNWLGEIALAVLVFDETGSPIATATLFLGMQFLPAIAAQGLVARAEVSGTRGVLPAVYAAEGAAFVALALIADNFMLALIVALAAVDGTLALAGRAFTRAAAAAVLAPSGQLREGNALLNICFTLAGAAGPAIAGIVVAGFGVQTALLLDAASFALVAAILLTARSLPSIQGKAEAWASRLRDGFRYVRERPVLSRLLAAQAVAFIFFAAVIPIEIVYAKKTLHAGSSGYGALLASWGIGMVVGSLLFAASRRISLQALLFFSTLLVGLAYISLSTAGTIAVACAMAAVGGTGNGVQWVSVMSAVQELTQASYQARVVALLESSGRAMPGIGFMIGGVVAQIASPRVSFFVAGTGVVLVTGAAVPLIRRAGLRSPEELEVVLPRREASIEGAPTNPMTGP